VFKPQHLRVPEYAHVWSCPSASRRGVSSGGEGGGHELSVIRLISRSRLLQPLPAPSASAPSVILEMAKVHTDSCGGKGGGHGGGGRNGGDGGDGGDGGGGGENGGRGGGVDGANQIWYPPEGTRLTMGKKRVLLENQWLRLLMACSSPRAEPDVGALAPAARVS